MGMRNGSWNDRVSHAPLVTGYACLKVYARDCNHPSVSKLQAWVVKHEKGIAHPLSDSLLTSRGCVTSERHFSVADDLLALLASI